VTRALVAAVLAGVLCACGSQAKAPAARETHACRVITAAAVGDARLLLHDYAGDASPADLPFYDLRVDLANTQARCLPGWLGEDLAAFPARRLHVLYALLPATYVTYLQLAVRCAKPGAHEPACTTHPRTIHSPGSTGTGSTPHPVKP